MGLGPQNILRDPRTPVGTNGVLYWRGANVRPNTGAKNKKGVKVLNPMVPLEQKKVKFKGSNQTRGHSQTVIQD